MLCFLPLTATELAGDFPPGRSVLVPTPDSGGAAEDDALLLEEDARDDAAFESLELARAEGALPTRLVASFETGPGQDAPTKWDALDSIYVDDRPGRSLCSRLLDAQTQEAADALAEELYAEPMMWFDGSERESLANALRRLPDIRT